MSRKNTTENALHAELARLTGPICNACLALVMLLISITTNAKATESFDVVVYGATASGVMAAVAAAREGMHVALLEPGKHVGGMVSGGLSNSDVDNQKQLVGGLAQEFFVRAGEHYGQPIAWTFEPHVAENIFRRLLDESRTYKCSLIAVLLQP